MDYTTITTQLLGPLGAGAIAIANGAAVALKHYLGWGGKKLLAAVVAISALLSIISALATGDTNLQTAIVQTIATFAGSQIVWKLFIQPTESKIGSNAIAQAAPTLPPSSPNTGSTQ